MTFELGISKQEIVPEFDGMKVRTGKLTDTYIDEIKNYEPDYYIVMGSLNIGIEGEYPNWFHRKMMSLFFGWEIKR